MPALPQGLHKDIHQLNLDCRNLYEFDRELYNQLIAYPMEVIPLMDLVIRNLAARNIQVSPRGTLPAVLGAHMGPKPLLRVGVPLPRKDGMHRHRSPP